ncbi:MAG TPA: NUDIX hydrolase [Actinomycetes bacterium]|nr:NUDIX hydrolase [Actinomycetes bacterium]
MNRGNASIGDEATHLEVLDRKLQFEGAKWRLVTDDVRLLDGTVVRRDVVQHPGAVGVLALDNDDNVVLIQQYRHPVATTLWEIPAGLLDEVGESPLNTARRELFEEAHLRAQKWHLLLDLYSSPGMSSEVVRIYLARGLSDVPVDEQHQQTDEEKDMPSVRVSLDQACEWVLAGRIHNSLAASALLAAVRERDRGWAGLRDPETDWPTQPAR